jgi:hypothetical protein
MIPDVPESSPAHARPPEPEGWTLPQVAFAAWQALLHIGITAIAFVVIYQTVTKVARPYLGRLDWAPVAAGEIAFIGLYGNSVLLAWRKKAPGVTRGVLMAAIVAGSVILNVYGARGKLPDVVIHLVIVGAFFGLMLDGKSVIARLRGGKVRGDRLSAAEWASHPVRSLRLARWMQAWAEPSRKAALGRYMRLLYAVALAQADERVGRVPLLWRRRLPVTLRYQLATGLLPEPIMAGEGDWQEAVSRHVSKQLSLLPAKPSAPPEGAPAESPKPVAKPRQNARQKRASSAAAKRAKAVAILTASPAKPLAEVARESGASERTVSRVKKDLPVPLHVAGGTR